MQKPLFILYMITLFLVVTFALFIPLTNPLAGDDQSVALIQTMESALNDIQTMKGDFIFLDQDQQGRFFLRKPGKMRFEFAPYGQSDLYVADGLMLHLYDPETGGYNNTLINQTPIGFLLDKTVNFEQDLKILSVNQKRTDETQMTLTLTRRQSPESGHITLYFNRDPVHLTGWDIFDPLGQLTRVRFENVSYNTPIEAGLFTFNPPEISGPDAPSNR